MIEIAQQPLDEKLKELVYQGFSQHAISQVGHDGKGKPIALVARDDGKFVGAVVAELFWGALHVKYVYVEKDYRSRGIASQLMARALNYGKANKCPFAFVETMSFQAPEFYQKLGFEPEFTRLGYKHNTSFHYLRKDLEPPKE